MKNFDYMFKKSITVIISLLITSFVFGQQRITGVVTSSIDNKPLSGVTIRILNSDIGTITDSEGGYTVEANDDSSRLQFSYLGFVAREMDIDSTVINVQLTPISTDLNELVVTGYTKEKKVDITGSVDIVNIENMTQQPDADVTTLLQGQASGLTIINSGQPGDAPQIRIRGINTFGNNTPLFIVDGNPTQDISNINPNDIASIQVLKDAGAASIYGSRASNGVIILTTKMGKDKVKVHYDGYYGRQYPISATNAFNKLDPMENAQLEWLALKNSGLPLSSPLYGTGPDPVLPDYLSPLGAKEGDPSVDPSLYFLNPTFDPDEFSSFYQITKANKEGTDWYNEIFNPAPVTSHDLSVNGGGEKGKFYISMNYFNKEGVLMNTFLKRYTVRANSEFNVSKSVRIGENIQYSIRNGRRVIGNSDQTNSIRNAATTPPIIPVYDIGGNFGGAHGTALFGDNPVAYQDRAKNNKDINGRLFGNVYADIDFLKLLTFHSNFGADINSGTQRSFNYPAYESYLPPNHSQYNESSSFNYSWIWSNTLSLTKEINSYHSLSLLIGTETNRIRTNNLSGAIQDFFSFDPNYTTLSSGSGTKTISSSRSIESLFSIFGKIGYSYNNKYILSATLRRDGSSKFIDNVYGWFPAFSVGWRISEEAFLRDLTWINELKIRGSWGIMGNQLNVNPDNGYSTFIGSRPSSYYDINGTNNSSVQGFQIGQIGAPQAKWEKDVNSNIGVDGTIFNGQMEFTIDYYVKDIRDLLYNPDLLGTAGLGTPPFVNIARMKNKGIDLSISGSRDISKDLSLNATVLFTSYSNKVAKVTDQTNHFWTADKRRFGTDFIRNEVGHSVGSFYGYKIIGFWNSETEIEEANNVAHDSTGDNSINYQDGIGLGRFRYEDVNGDGVVNSEDRTFIGDPNPKFSYGLNLGLNYKNFDLSASFYGVSGNQIWNNLIWWTDFYNSFGTGKSRTALYDSWQPDHQDAKVAIQETVGFPSTNTEPNSYFVQSGSYFRAKNILFGYTLPSDLLNKINIERLRIYVQAVNPFTVTKYPGLDPEISGSVTDFGVDGGSFPHSREFYIGVNIDF